MLSVCPLSAATMVLERASDILMAPSVEPAAKKSPASFRASAYTLPLCPSHALGSYSPPCRAARASTDSAVYVVEDRSPKTVQQSAVVEAALLVGRMQYMTRTCETASQVACLPCKNAQVCRVSCTRVMHQDTACKCWNDFVCCNHSECMVVGKASGDLHKGLIG